MSQPILIISTGRTGTIFFSKLIGDLYSNVAAYHERGFSRPIQILTNAYFANLFPDWGLKLSWLLLKENEIKSCTKAYHLDANCFLYGILSVVPELHPGIKVIHVVRDPRAYVTSHLNFSRFRATSFIANYLIPFWQPSPFLTNEIGWQRYFTLTRMERYAWIWEFKNRVMESLEGTNTPYLRVRFEDIFYSSQPEEEFGQITDFIGLPRKGDIYERFYKPVNQSPKDKFPDWSVWTDTQSERFQAICGKRMKKYDYGNEIDWQRKIGAL